MDSVVLNKKKEQEEKEFDYSLGLIVMDVIQDPDVFWKKIEYEINKKGFIFNHKRVTIKRNKNELTFKCGRKTLIIYPPRKDRDNCYLAILKTDGVVDGKRRIKEF